MRSLLLVLVLASGTSACAKQKSFVAPIWPKEATKLPPLALGEIVMEALPRGQLLAWDSLQIPSVKWRTDGIETTSNYQSFRDGIARIRAGGQSPKMLRQTWVELAWTISLEASQNPKFGPEKIVLTPGMSDSEHMCFGIRFQGCSFPVSALNHPGLTLKKQCERGPGGDHSIVFDASAPGGRKGIVIYHTDAGSGDTTTHVEVLAGNADTYCGSNPD